MAVSSGGYSASNFAGSAGFLPTFGDVTFWNIVSSFVVISNASIYPFVTDLMLVVNVTGVSPETALP
jgi:hypothetical protein